MLNIDLSKIEPQWHDFAGAKLQIRPYKTSMSNTTVRQSKDGGTEMTLKNQDEKDAYMYSFMDAEELPITLDGKPSKLTAAIKEAIYDYEHVLKTGIPKFVLITSGALRKKEETEEKN